MNLSQKQTILNAIESFEKADFETAFAQNYKDTATIDSVSAADYSVAELFALARKSVEQLKKRLKRLITRTTTKARVHTLVLLTLP